MQDYRCGIMSYGIYLPSQKISSYELAQIWDIPEDVIVNKIGLKEKVIGQKEDHAIQMTLKAAKNCLDNADISPEDIDVVIYNGEEYKEYICYTVAIKIIKELKLVNAWGFDVGQRCSATIIGMKLAQDIINSDENVNTILICGGSTASYLVNEKDKNSSFMLPGAPGACSIVLRRGCNKNRVLGSCVTNNSKFIDDIICKCNGTEDPSVLDTETGMWKFALPNFDTMKNNLRLEATDYIIEVARGAVKKSGLSLSEISYVAISHINRKAHKYILNELGFDEEQSIYLDNYGHVGHVDNILSIDLGIKANKIKKGDRILMIGLGIGFSYGALVIEWGENNLF